MNFIKQVLGQSLQYIVKSNHILKQKEIILLIQKISRVSIQYYLKSMLL